MRIKEFKKIAILGLVVAEVALVLISWVLSAIQTEGVQSLLSSEGIRWLFSSSVSSAGCRKVSVTPSGIPVHRSRIVLR